jgi:hypothetical protein
VQAVASRQPRSERPHGTSHLWRLHGLSVAELCLRKQAELIELLKLGNFF